LCSRLRIGPQLHPGEDGHLTDVRSAPENLFGMAVEPHGGAVKMRRPIVIQCHTDGPLEADKSRILRPFSMILAVPTETRVRFPSPAPILLLSKFAVFQATVLRVSYEAARNSPVSLGFQPRNRNRGSGASDLSG